LADLCKEIFYCFLRNLFLSVNTTSDFNSQEDVIKNMKAIIDSLFRNSNIKDTLNTLDYELKKNIEQKQILQRLTNEKLENKDKLFEEFIKPPTGEQLNDNKYLFNLKPIAHKSARDFLINKMIW
jgi:hypothetical protein